MPDKQDLIALMERRAEEQAAGRDVSLVELCGQRGELLSELERLCRIEGQLESILTNQTQGSSTPENAVQTMQLRGKRANKPAAKESLPTLPGYTLLDELGQGGMGVVYRALDLKLEREVALKVIRPERLSSDALVRFKAEARAVARLDHPNIVQIYEVGTFGSTAGPEVPFLSLEYVAGGNLEERVGRDPMPPLDAARIVCLLARGMAHAHARGVVHRDLKPANVLIAPPAEEASLNASIGRPKITDFGLARRHDKQEPQITGAQTVLGTPAYMAPEQAAGQIAGPAADVYALGAILYRLLTGRAVFASDTAVDTLYHVRHTAPPPISNQVPGVSPALESLCLSCLRKQAAQRPSAEALASALETLTGYQPSKHRVQRPKRRRVAALAAAALFLIGMGVALGVGTRSSPKTNADLGQNAGSAEPQAVPVAEQHMKGTLDVQMTRRGDMFRQDKYFWDPAAIPLQAGDLVRVRAILSQPMYAYLAWIDTEGKVTLMYPWPNGVQSKLDNEVKSEKFYLPEDANRKWVNWPIGPGLPGLETVVLLCRKSPLPESVDLKAVLGEFGPQPAPGSEYETVGWFENGRLVRNDPLRGARGPLLQTVNTSRPTEDVNWEIHRRVEKYFDYCQSITYGNRGGRE